MAVRFKPANDIKNQRIETWQDRLFGRDMKNCNWSLVGLIIVTKNTIVNHKRCDWGYWNGERTKMI